MLALPALVVALTVSTQAADLVRPRAPDPTLSANEVAARIESYLGAIDTAAKPEDWRALGLPAIPALEAVLAAPDALPSRRAAAVSGLAHIGGARARSAVIKTLRSEAEPFVVRAAALHAAPSVLSSAELVHELTPVLEGAQTTEARVVAAEVLARSAPRLACRSVRAQAGGGPARPGHFARALATCAATP